MNQRRSDRTILPHEKILTGAVYLDMVENSVVPQVPDGYVFQKDGAPTHFWTPATEFLNK
jgi:hypothetical protein